MQHYHGTTIVSVRRGAQVALGGDGQVTLGHVVVKGGARKVRRIYHDKVLAGFAGGTADAFSLLDRFEGKLEKYQGHLMRAAVELAKDWRTDRMLRRLEAMLIVANVETTLVLTGNGDVLDPEDGICAIGSGGARSWTNRWKSPLSSVFIQTRTVSLRRLIRAFFSGLHGIARARRMSSLRGRLHRYAMETCSARIDLHTVFALDSLCNLTEKCSKGFF